MSDILVTGAAGCLGSSLVRALVEKGKRVRVFIKPGRWHPFLDGLPVKVFRGDIRDHSQVMEAMAGCEQVYQVAGVVSYALKDHQEMYTTHVDGVRTLLSAAENLGIRKVVVTASTAGIGIPSNPDHPLTEESAFDDSQYKRVMYMYSKYLTLQECRKAAQRGLNVVAVSPTTIYGAGDMKMHVGKIVKRLKEERVGFAPPGGNAVIAMDDVVDAHLLAMERGVSGENYLVANEHLSYLSMFNIITRLLHVRSVSRASPQWVRMPAFRTLQTWERALLFFDKRPTLPANGFNFTFKHRYFNATKAHKELGWRPKRTFEEAIKSALSFYEAQSLL